MDQVKYIFTKNERTPDHFSCFSSDNVAVVQYKTGLERKGRRENVIGFWADYRLTSVSMSDNFLNNKI